MKDSNPSAVISSSHNLVIKNIRQIWHYQSMVVRLFLLRTPIYSFVDWTWQMLNTFCLPMKKKGTDKFFSLSIDSLDVECEMGNYLLIIYGCHQQCQRCYTIIERTRICYTTRKKVQTSVFKKKTYTVKTNMDNTSSHLLDIYQQSMYIYTETYTW